MNRIYYVIIKGRTLESRNVRELLARAVMEKRKLDHNARTRARFQNQAPSESISNSYRQAGQAAAF